MSDRRRSREEIAAALRRFWFPVARACDLERPQPATLLGERLVVYRTEQGEPRVLARRCIHRGASLAGGEVHGDLIACPYHGWRFEGESGRCTHIPSLGPGRRVPAAARVTSYPAAVRWGLVWTCLEQPLVGLPDPPQLHALELEWLPGPPLPAPVGVAAATENFRDVSHFPFVHRASMGDVPQVVEPLEVRREGGEAWMERRVPAAPGASWSADGDSWMRYHAIAPAVSLIVYEYDGRGRRVLVNCPSPVGPEDCVIFWAVAVEAGFRGMSLREAMESEHAVYLEDMPILCDLDPREVPFDREAVEVSVPADRFTLAYRRAFLHVVEQSLAGGAAPLHALVDAAG